MAILSSIGEKGGMRSIMLEKGGQVIAIEVKSSYVKNKKGMEAFRQKFNPHKIYLIDNKVLPWYEF